jgi:dienelactone hydrolase
MPIRRLLLFFLLISVWPLRAQTPDLANVTKLFDYDQKAPLDLQQKSVEDRRATQVHDISFSSPMGGRVSAYLVTPQGKGPFAGIVFLHSGQWDRHEFLAEAELLAQAGAVSVLLDAPPMRPPQFQKRQPDRLHGYIQMVVDCRRAVDLLLQLPAEGAASGVAAGASQKRLVDPKRIAYVGHSLGATWGGALAVSERRFKALVLMAGFSQYSVSAKEFEIPPSQLEKAQPFLAAVAPLDNDKLLPHAAPAALLFQFAWFDPYITHEDAQRSAQSASEPKTVKWYEGGHDFADPRALPDRAEFLHQQIGIAPLRPILQNELGWSGKKKH